MTHIYDDVKYNAWLDTAECFRPQGTNLQTIYQCPCHFNGEPIEVLYVQDTLIGDICSISPPKYKESFKSYVDCAWSCNSTSHITIITEDNVHQAPYACTVCPPNKKLIDPSHVLFDKCTTYNTDNEDWKNSIGSDKCCEVCPKPSNLILRSCPTGTYYYITENCQNIQCIQCSNKDANQMYVRLNNIESADFTQINSCYTAPIQKECETGFYPQTYERSIENVELLAQCAQCSKLNHQYFKIYDPLQLSINEQYCSTMDCISSCPVKTYNLNCEDTSIYHAEDTMCSTCILLKQEVSSDELILRLFKDKWRLCSIYGCPNGYYIFRNQSFSQYDEITCKKCTYSPCPIGEYNKCDGSTYSNPTCTACPIDIKPNILGAIWDLSVYPMIGVDTCQWKCNINYYRNGDFCRACNTNHLTCNIGQYIKATCLTSSGVTEEPECATCVIHKDSTATSSGYYINKENSCDYLCNQPLFFHVPYDCVLRTILSCPIPGTYLEDGTPYAEHVCQTCPKPSTWINGITFFSNGCQTACASGYYTDPSIQGCSRCPNGKFKGTAGNEPCTSCPPNTYQSNMDIPQNCLEAPAHSTVWENASYFTCNQGYELFLLPLIACEKCSFDLANIPSYPLLEHIKFSDNSCELTEVRCNQAYRLSWYTSAVHEVEWPTCTMCAFETNIDYQEFQVNTCQTSVLTCKPGYYRTFQTTCAICPTISDAKEVSYVDTSAPPIVLLEPGMWQGYNDAVVNTCGKIPNSICKDQQDERNLACPISNGCYTGFYVDEYTNMPLTSKTQTQICSVCQNVTTCLENEKFSFCTNNEKENKCELCTNPLTEGQIWVQGSLIECEWACTYGYFMHMETSTSPSSSDFPSPLTSNICKACPTGYYQPSNQSYALACTPCPDGFVSEKTSASRKCIACSPGFFSNGLSATCTHCQGGQYSEYAASSYCTLCPVGKFNSNNRMSHCLACAPETPYSPVGGTQCSLPTPSACAEYPGFYMEASSSQCQMCPHGMICNQAQATVCSSDSNRRYSNIMSSTQADCMPSLPYPCVRKNPTSIKKCPDNTWTGGFRGSPSILWCHPKPGFFGIPGQVALPCPREHYCNPALNLQPIQCPPHAPFAPPMSYSLDNCTSVMYAPCKQGFFPPFQQRQCQPCPQGSYCPGGSSIVACDYSSAWFSESQSTSINDCYNKVITASVACPANTFALTSPIDSVLRCRAVAGYFFIPSYHSHAEPCPQNYYCPLESLTPMPCPPQDPCNHARGLLTNTNRCPAMSSAPQPACTACSMPLPPHAYYPNFNNCSFCCDTPWLKFQLNPSSHITCVPISDSRDCPEHFYMPEDTSQCSFLTQTCRGCPVPLKVNEYTAISAQERNALIDSRVLPFLGNGSCILTCLPGFYKKDQSCVPCAAGKFNPDTGYNLNESSCRDCAQGTYAANTGSSSCDSCGKWSVPASDEKCAKCQIANKDRSVCLLCSSWRMPRGGRVNCTCVKGTYTKVIVHPETQRVTYACEECPPGSVSSSINPFLCGRCEPGHICSINQAIYRSCPPGSFKASNFSSCEPCKPGFYSDAAMSTACKTCPLGSYNPSSSSSACVLCPANTSSRVLGAISPDTCQKCPDHMLASEGSQRCDCPSNYYLSPPSTCLVCATCHANATNVSPCQRGTLRDTSVCVCKDGFTGDGFRECKRCTEASKCICETNLFRAIKIS